MAAFEYLSVLISIILALGMTRVLGGVGEMLQARSHRRIYWVHAIWIINLFLYLVIAWWIFYRWRNQQPWTFFLFVFVLISPTVLYLASLLLFPRESDVGRVIDYKTHYYANHRAFLSPPNHHHQLIHFSDTHVNAQRANARLFFFDCWLPELQLSPICSTTRNRALPLIIRS